MSSQENIQITCPSFENTGDIPKKHTGFGRTFPRLFSFRASRRKPCRLQSLWDDLDIPIIKALNHWLIWNVPQTEFIPENIPYGAVVPSLGTQSRASAMAETGQGPKQPVFVRSMHRYVFHFYVLDCFLDLDSRARKSNLLEAMKGHVLQQGKHYRKV
jgi:phosphatidylethanolamine-binding protein (PEBP) family uncharacterized protein